MQQSILEKLEKVYNVLEYVGKVVVPDAMITVHRKEGLEGIWWYRMADGKMEYSDTARSHFDNDFDLADPEARNLARGRIGKYRNEPFVFIYTHDFSDERIPGPVLSDIVKKLERASGLELDTVVDEEGRDLLAGGRL